MRKYINIQWSLMTLIFATAASASKYDDCILNGIKGARSDAAVVSITRACQHISQQQVPSDALARIDGNAQFVPAGRFNVSTAYIRLSLRNRTKFQITSIAISLQNIKSGVTKTYTQTEFNPEVGRFVDPTLVLSIAPGEVREFIVPIDETESSDGTFFKEFSWSIASAKGVAQ